MQYGCGVAQVCLYLRVQTERQSRRGPAADSRQRLRRALPIRPTTSISHRRGLQPKDKRHRGVESGIITDPPCFCNPYLFASNKQTTIVEENILERATIGENSSYLPRHLDLKA